MSKVRIIAAAAFIIAVFSFSISCWNDDSEKIIVKVMSNGVNFTGSILTDGNPPWEITSVYSSGTTYYYEISVESIDSLYVSATAAAGDTTLTIIVYRQNGDTEEIAKQATLNLDALDTQRTLILTYEYGEETEETKTSSSSSTTSK